MKKTNIFFGLSAVILTLSSVLAVKANNKKFNITKTLYINYGGWKAVLNASSATTIFTTTAGTNNVIKCVINSIPYTAYSSAGTTSPVYTIDIF
jgi:hypothetical protein